MKTKPKLKPHKKPIKTETRLLSPSETTKFNGAVITSFCLNHYLKELQHLGIFKQSLKQNTNRTRQDLLIVEKEHFDKIDDLSGGQEIDKIVSNYMEFIEWMTLRYNFADFTTLHEIIIAYDKDWKSMKERADEINNRIKS